MNKDSYDPLLTGDYGEDTILENTSRLSHGSTRRNSLSSYLITAAKIFPWILSFILATIIIYDRTNGWDRFRQHKLYASQQAYSPAQNEIEYKLTKFHTNIVDAPDEFQGGPSETLNKAWDDLFNCQSLINDTIFQYHMFDDLTLMLNQLVYLQSPKLKQNYSQTIHHQYLVTKTNILLSLTYFTNSTALYVLISHYMNVMLTPDLQNIFRKAFTPIYLSDWEYVKDAEASLNWTVPESYPYEAFEENRVKNSINPWHIGHCLESLRQSIMCHADVTPAVWHWDYSVPNPVRNKPWLTVLHTCRDFDRIRDWAEKHKIRWDFDYNVQIPQQFDIPTYP